jgi:hypothetical protein
MSPPSAFDLFLDESGTFTETSTDPAEQAASLRQPRRFASQFAGLLAPRGDLTAGKARDVLNQALKAASLPASKQVHAHELLRHAYDAVVREAVERIGKQGPSRGFAQKPRDCGPLALCRFGAREWWTSAGGLPYLPAGWPHWPGSETLRMREPSLRGVTDLHSILHRNVKRR